MDSKNTQKDVWLTYCEECVMSKIDKNVPQEYKEEPGENADTNL